MTDSKRVESRDIKSPCIRHCCLNENDLCLGCYRSLEEILNWHSLTAAQKEHVITLCNERKPDYKV
ncbi:DUF1289 domain-containing protein [Vibrio sp. 10N.261.55.A7]|uniref:DUF1289 domain-containing protein n=1 Tax=Vibrio sp. 10N.261.55.A7 TaxID=1880851 RepID=UPI000C81525C|nr:DUF1289 domain-containing protein [Vibrio sp. 10N.261.55.A7]